MFHLEMHQGIQSARVFNLTEATLGIRFLTPLMAHQEFTYEGHDWTPRKMRIRVFEGPELQTYQLGMGRGWQTVERDFDDVTATVLEKARHEAATASAQEQPAPSTPEQQVAPATEPPVAIDALRERLIGRLFAGPIAFADVLAMAAELLPDASPEGRQAAAERAALELLHTGGAQLTR